MCANLISCASGELNTAVDRSGRRGEIQRERDGDVSVSQPPFCSVFFLEGLQFRGRSRWTANNQTAAVINSA